MSHRFSIRTRDPAAGAFIESARPSRRGNVGRRARPPWPECAPSGGLFKCRSCCISMWQKLTQMRHTESSTAATGRGSILRCFPGLLLVLLLCAVSARGQVVINEIVADNNLSLADEDGAFSDWIEIYNTGGVDVNL